MMKLARHIGYQILALMALIFLNPLFTERVEMSVCVVCAVVRSHLYTTKYTQQTTTKQKITRTP